MSIMNKMKTFVKKVFAIIFAMIIGFTPVTAANNSDILLDLPSDVKETIWYNGYNSRCRNYGRRNAFRNYRTVKRVARRVLLAPLTLLIGTAVAEPVAYDIAEDAILPEDSTDKKEIIVTRLKDRVPALSNNSAVAVADLLFTMDFDTVEALNIEDLIKIPGIEEESASMILADRWYFADKLVFADEYTVIEKAKVDRIRQREVTFNRFYDPQKDKPAEAIEAKDISTGEGEVHRMLKSNGYEPYDTMITVVGLVDDSNRPNGRADLQKALWSKWSHAGFTARGGKKFMPLYHGTNGGRYGKVIFVREDVYSIVRKFLRNGARDGAETTEAKEAAYMGLLNPGTFAWKTYYGFDLQPERVAIVKSWKKLFKNQTVDFVNIETGEVKIKAIRDVIENMFDGQYLIDPSAKTLSEMSNEQKDIYNKSGDSTGRAPYWKGLGRRVYFHAALREMGVKYINTINNGKMNLEDIDIIADESVMKAKFGTNGHFENWAEYCNNFHQLNQHFCVLITEHEDRLHSLPNQQMQAMVGADKKDLQELIDAEIKYLKSFKDKDNAASLLGGEMKKIVKAVPGMHRHSWIADREQSSYDKLVREAKAAALHNIAHYTFFGKDPIAQMQHVAWACSNMSEELQNKYADESDYAKGCIDADTVVFRSAKGSETECVLSRNPSTDAQAQCVMKVTKTYGKYDKYIPYSTTCDISVLSYVATRVRGDHDGDHVFLCFIKALIRMAKTANEFTGGRLIDWEAPETKKHPVTEESMKDYFGGLTEQSQLGHFCDMNTSLIGYGVAGYNHEAACWLVMAINVFVDAAKHGKGSVKVPEYVLRAVARKDADGEPLLDEKDSYIRRPMPIYAMQGKDNQHPNNKEKKVGSDRCSSKLGFGNGDVIYRRISENVDSKLIVDLDGVENFNVNELMYDFEGARNGGKSWGLRGCDELFILGNWNAETKTREGQGLWMELCFERKDALKALAQEASEADDDRFAYNEARRNTEYLRRYMAIKRLNDWAAEHGKTIEDVFDAITFWTWKKNQVPVRFAKEDINDYNKRKMKFDIFVDGWTKMLGGLALRAIYQRKALGDLLGMTAAAADGFDIDDSFMEDVA